MAVSVEYNLDYWMKSLFNYIISTESRYNNKKEVGNKELILNTEVTERDYMFVNRIGKVLRVAVRIASTKVAREL